MQSDGEPLLECVLQLIGDRQPGLEWADPPGLLLVSVGRLLSPPGRIRILASPTIQVSSPADGSLQIRNGAFSVARIGGMPISAAAGAYILEATANLSDGRVLKLNATVLCEPPGY